MATFKFNTLRVTQITRGKRLIIMGQTKHIQAFKYFETQPMRSLSMAYALHEPPNTEAFTLDRAIIILHGLFGSKQNNRSISKYDPFSELAVLSTLILMLIQQGLGTRSEKAGICSCPFDTDNIPEVMQLTEVGFA